MATLQDVMDRSRRDLQDADKDRWYDNEDMLPFLNEFIGISASVRADLFIVNEAMVLPVLPLALGATFPMPERYIAAACHYIKFRAHIRDDESTNTTAVKLGHDAFVEQLLRS